jgi:hypothetical protein
MSWQAFESRSGKYIVDWETVFWLIRSCNLAEIQLDSFSAPPTSASRFYNPFSWWLPSIKEVSIDWDTVHQQAYDRAVEDYNRFFRDAKSDMPHTARGLERRIMLSGHHRREFLSRMQQVQRENMRQIREADKDYETLIEGSKWVRNTSAQTLLIISTVSSGGAAAAALGAGSVGTGLITYQDTGNVGAAVIKGTTALTVNYFKIGGAQVDLKEEAILLVVEIAADTAADVACGKDFADSLGKNAATGIAGEATGKVLTGPLRDPVKKLLSKTGVPIVITHQGENLSTAIAAKVVNKQAEEFSKRQVGKLFVQGKPVNTKPGGGSVVRNSTMTRMHTLLNLAIRSGTNVLQRGW